MRFLTQLWQELVLYIPRSLVILILGTCLEHSVKFRSSENLPQDRFNRSRVTFAIQLPQIGSLFLEGLSALINFGPVYK